ncbi:MAG TPA: hypothetical protein VMM77_11920 [Gemmatimonadaceae bacterium]|nr:hypothetical protein [Gemmatimonadaceae bacterium]
MKHSAVLLMAPLALTAPTLLSAQAWRTVTAERQSRAADTLRVRVDYTVGALSIGAASDTILYRSRLRYDANRFEPVRTFDLASNTLRMGVRGDTDVPLRIGGGAEEGTLALELSRAHPVDLHLDLGATSAEIDLSGVAVSRLAINSGASEITLQFGTANPVAMHELTIDAGVARVEIRKLGNANADRMRITGGAASIDLDLSGAWQGERKLQVALTFGAATIRVPRGTGVRVKHSRVLGTFDATGLSQRDDAHVSDDWDTAKQRVVIDARTSFGTLNLKWIVE